MENFLLALKQDLMLANAASAVFVIVFAIYFCIRMVTNTKTACKIILLTGCLMAGYHHSVTPLLSYFSDFTLIKFLGLFIFATAIVLLLKGLNDEEASEEYVHGRKYWWMTVAALYSGLFLIVGGKVFLWV